MSAVTVIVKQAAESTEQTIRDWLIAAGTVGATMAAVYIGVIRERLRLPKLSLEYSPHTEDAVVVGTVGGSESAFVRLRVVAARNKKAAEDVEVMILDAAETLSRPGWRNASKPFALGGQLLKWSNTDGAPRSQTARIGAPAAQPASPDDTLTQCRGPRTRSTAPMRNSERGCEWSERR